MVTHKRVKDIDYDDDELYPSDEEDTEAETYTAEDRAQFAALTPVVRAALEEEGIVGIGNGEIEDALWHYYWDVAKSVGYLKGTKGIKDVGKSGHNGAKGGKPRSKFEEIEERRAREGAAAAVPAATSKPAQSKGTKELEKKTQNLKFDGEPPKPPQPKVRSKNMDVPKLWTESVSTRKLSAAFVVIGHIDHGKSTLMGRLLLDTGAVPQRDIDRYRKEAAEMGKASFALAWVMDSTADEREHGVTVGVATHHFSTEKSNFTILDAPGHRDFVPAMIGGASMADLGLLVVDAGQLESGLKGQTKEHCILASAVGIKRMIVAVNKMDYGQSPWDQATFNSVRDQVSALLAETGFDPSLATFIPCSGLLGENVVNPLPTTGSTAWLAQSNIPTLIGALEDNAKALPSPEPLLSQPLRFQLNDIFQRGAQNNFVATGRLSAGCVQPGEAVIIQPHGERATIKSIEIADEAAPYAVAGQLASLYLDGHDESIDRNLRAGDILFSAARPVQPSVSFVAEVKVTYPTFPMTLDVHFGQLHIPGTIKELIEVVGGKKKPKMVRAGQTARIRIRFVDDREVAVAKGMGFVLRSRGGTVASGYVE